MNTLHLSTDKHFTHQYKRGKKTRESRRQNYYERDDVCQLCGCIRTSIEYIVDNILFESVVQYSRSKQIYSRHHEPLCWGSLKPE